MASTVATELGDSVRPMPKPAGPIDSPYLVPFDNSFRIGRAKTRARKSELDADANRAKLDENVAKIAKLQTKLYAEAKQSLLLVFQAMDAAGKDSTIRAVMTGINPAGCHVSSFKTPSKEELAHDFLWRLNRKLPERGMIGIFNRSHYEEVLIVRVHPELLDAQPLPQAAKKERAKKEIWAERFESIRDFEKHLARNGTRVVKFFLHVGKDAQKERFLDRIEQDDSNWKFQAADVHERAFFPKYMQAYEEALNATSRAHAPWYCIPADDKPFMRKAVAEIVRQTLEQMNPRFPDVDSKSLIAMVAAKESLLREK